MATTKLKNIKAVNEMLLGTHRTQTRTTVGFSDTESATEKNKHREVGETWEEKDFNGNITYITQEKGFRIKSNVSPEVSAMLSQIREDSKKFPNCQKETCTCKVPTALDLKFKAKTGMCEDCLVTMETKLKIQGKFNQYALDKMKQNAESFFVQADKEVEVVKDAMKEISFVDNEHGDVQKWEFDNADALIEKVDSDYKKFKEKTLAKFEAGA